MLIMYLACSHCDKCWEIKLLLLLLLILVQGLPCSVSRVERHLSVLPIYIELQPGQVNWYTRLQPIVAIFQVAIFLEATLCTSSLARALILNISAKLIDVYLHDSPNMADLALVLITITVAAQFPNTYRNVNMLNT